MTALRTVLIALSLAAAALVFAPAASAGDPEIEAAIAAGVVGERIDGYLGVVSADADPALVRKVQDINNRRRGVYEEIARRNGTTIDIVAQVAGEKQVQAKIQEGQFFMDDSGDWQRK